MAGDKLTFAAIVLVAIVAIVGMIGLMGYGGLPTVTGLDTFQTGTAQVNITGTICVDLTDSSIAWAGGSVDQNSLYAEIESNNSATYNGSWSSITDSMTIENCGNINLDIDVNMSNVDFVGGTAGTSISYFMANDDTEPGSCTTWENLEDTWITFAASNTLYDSCGTLLFDDTVNTDQMDLYLKLRIPADAPVAVPSTTIGFVATTA